jgi:hypothetical protein
MPKIHRKVTITGEGPFLTAGEIMMACAQVPDGMVPTVQISMGGKIKSMSFEVDYMPQAE